MNFFRKDGDFFFFQPHLLHTSPWANETAFGILGNPTITRLLDSTLRRLSPCLCCYYTSDVKRKNYVNQELCNYLKYYNHQAYLGSTPCVEVGKKLISGKSTSHLRKSDYKWLSKNQRAIIKDINSAGIPLHFCANTRCIWVTKSPGVTRFNRLMSKKHPMRVRKPDLNTLVKQRYIGYMYLLFWPGELGEFLEIADSIIKASPKPETACTPAGSECDTHRT